MIVLGEPPANPLARPRQDDHPPEIGDNHRMDTEVNVLALVKGEERFLFLFDDDNRDETLRQMARFAANPELDFSWYDAAMLSQKIRDACPAQDDMMAADDFESLSIDDL